MLEPDYIIYSGNGINLVYLLKNIVENGNMPKASNYLIQSNIEKRRVIVKHFLKTLKSMVEIKNVMILQE